MALPSLNAKPQNTRHPEPPVALELPTREPRMTIDRTPILIAGPMGLEMFQPRRFP